MSLKDESRRDLVSYRIEKAYKAIEHAKVNLNLGYLEVTANRLYYAAYYTASALLIANKILAHSHEGVITQFGFNFVKTGKVDREKGKLLSKLFSLRLKGDYSDKFDLKEEDLQPLIEPSEEFVPSISTMALEAISSLSN